MDELAEDTSYHPSKCIFACETLRGKPFDRRFGRQISLSFTSVEFDQKTIRMEGMIPSLQEYYASVQIDADHPEWPKDDNSFPDSVTKLVCTAVERVETLPSCMYIKNEQHR